MPQTEMDWLLSFALFETSDRVTRSEGHTFPPQPSVLSSVTRVDAPVALQQSRTLRTSVSILSCLCFNPCQRGHLYFGN